MASRRKAYVRTKPEHVMMPQTVHLLRGAFMRDLLDGTIKATALHEVRAGEHLTRLDYDDPEG
jgi:hypothetical protein